MLPLGNIIRNHSINFHCYADDTQLYLSIKPDESNQLSKLQTCLKDIKSWMSCNFLMLNSEKTEILVLGPKNLRDSMSIAPIDGQCFPYMHSAAARRRCWIFSAAAAAKKKVQPLPIHAVNRRPASWAAY